MFDSCGRAGGHLPPALSGKASFGGVYITTAHATLGDDGSRTLKPKPSGATWAPGKSYEVTWAVQANHVKDPAKPCTVRNFQTACRL